MGAASFEQIRLIAADVLGVSPKSLSPDSGPETIESWDSVQHLNMVLAIEQQFDLQFDPEEIDAMKTLADIAAAVDSKQARSSA
jgi:acyl carrier protein